MHIIIVKKDDGDCQNIKYLYAAEIRKCILFKLLPRNNSIIKYGFRIILTYNTFFKKNIYIVIDYINMYRRHYCSNYLRSKQ